MAAMWSLLISTLLFGSSFANLTKALCSISDPKVDDCLKNQIMGLVPQLSREGFPKIHVKPLDPLRLNSFTITPENTHFRGKIAIANFEMTGLSNTTITELRSNLTSPVHQTLEMKVTIPELLITGNYSAEFLWEKNINIYGTGYLDLQLRNIEVTGKLAGRTILLFHRKSSGKNGTNYFQVESVDVVPKIENLKMNATNLFNNMDTLMSDFAHDVVNRYWHLYFDRVFPKAKPYLDTFIKTKINEFIADIPTSNYIQPW